MTSAGPLEYYPAYCFHLSPTINKWCPLRATDIHRLEGRPGFEGDNVFFFLNHPIRWVRIVGVVVAIDDFYGWRYYTVDDSTGACIQCRADIVRPAKSAPDDAGDEKKAAAPASLSEAASGIDVGMVVEVKGGTRLFRDQMEISVHKIRRLRSTSQEVQFWDKIRQFRREVLSQPWVLERREVRRCKKQHTADVDTEEKRQKKRVGNGYAAARDPLSRRQLDQREEKRVRRKITY
ncbi:hypothetical protein GGS23DRAFT_554703 [Durotheca rogersii]|uniref:uncharacterized protein n=1 Tax=Durotheca rogersii TaxID=419775 RepID=UPI00221E6136|nr:uncharacterized protein GGS23DRAFT_554703 [Durotheca rogersii]KAI5865937.1 hypothetical protein GGS23DRAFT_554703 [Durotheca rogersii]